MKYIISALLLVLSVSHSIAKPREFTITRVIDGDTVEFKAPFLIEELGQFLKLRVLGVDTPEKGKNAKCDKEEQMSLRAKLFVEQQISNGKKILVDIKKWDKYGGRVLGDILIDGKTLSSMLIEQKYAVSYNGKGQKNDWCK
jgi:endonuclease YncB( thermonuclease family)